MTQRLERKFAMTAAMETVGQLHPTELMSASTPLLPLTVEDASEPMMENVPGTSESVQQDATQLDVTSTASMDMKQTATIVPPASVELLQTAPTSDVQISRAQKDPE
jgi:hypothetical protein